METYFNNRQHKLTATHLYLNEPLPQLANFDWLIVMGGPMSANDETAYPWLREEKRLINLAIKSGKIVLGICLGAQLIADALGARIYKNRHREIGWFPIWPREEINTTILKDLLPSRLEVFHWHGETFEIPQGGVPIAYSEACENQGFIIDNRILGLQFHLETTSALAKALIQNSPDELTTPSPFVQEKNEILKETKRFSRINTVMWHLLEKLESQCTA